MTSFMKSFVRQKSGGKSSRLQAGHGAGSDSDSGLSDDSDVDHTAGFLPWQGISASVERVHRRAETCMTLGMEDMNDMPEENESAQDPGAPTWPTGVETKHADVVSVGQQHWQKLRQKKDWMAGGNEPLEITNECEAGSPRRGRRSSAMSSSSQSCVRQSSKQQCVRESSKQACAKDSSKQPSVRDSLAGIQVPKIDEHSSTETANVNAVKASRGTENAYVSSFESGRTPAFASCDSLVAHVVQQSNVLDVKKELLHKLVGDEENAGKREEETRFIWKLQDSLLRQAWGAFECELSTLKNEMFELRKSLQDAETRTKLIQTQSMREVAVLRDQLVRVPDGTTEALESARCLVTEKLVDEATQGLVQSLVSSTFKQVCADAENGHTSELNTMIRDFLADERKAMAEDERAFKRKMEEEMAQVKMSAMGELLALTEEKAAIENRAVGLDNKVVKLTEEIAILKTREEQAMQACNAASSEDPFCLGQMPLEAPGEADKEDRQSSGDAVDLDDIVAIRLVITEKDDPANPEHVRKQEESAPLCESKAPTCSTLFDEAATIIQGEVRALSHCSDKEPEVDVFDTVLWNSEAENTVLLSEEPCPLQDHSRAEASHSPSFSRGSRGRQDCLRAFQVAAAEVAAATGYVHPSSSSRSPFHADDHLGVGKHRPVLPGASAATLLDHSATLHDNFLQAPGDAIDIAVDLLSSLQCFHNQLDAELLNDARALYSADLVGIAVQMMIGRIRGAHQDCESLRRLCVHLLHSIKDIRTVRQARQVCYDLGPMGKTQGSQISQVFSAARVAYTNVQIERSHSSCKTDGLSDLPMSRQISPPEERSLTESSVASESLPVGSRLASQMKRIDLNSRCGWQEQQSIEGESVSACSSRQEKNAASSSRKPHAKLCALNEIDTHPLLLTNEVPSSTGQPEVAEDLLKKISNKVAESFEVANKVTQLDSPSRAASRLDVCNDADLRCPRVNTEVSNKRFQLEPPENPSRKIPSRAEFSNDIDFRHPLTHEALNRHNQLDALDAPARKSSVEALSPKRKPRIACLAPTATSLTAAVVMDGNFAALPALQTERIHVDDQNGRIHYKQSAGLTPRTPKGQVGGPVHTLANSRAPSRDQSRRASAVQQIISPNAQKLCPSKVLQKCMDIKHTFPGSAEGSRGLCVEGDGEQAFSARDSESMRSPKVSKASRYTTN